MPQPVLVLLKYSSMRITLTLSIHCSAPYDCDFRPHLLTNRFEDSQDQKQLNVTQLLLVVAAVVGCGYMRAGALCS